ncbi:MAG TPA: NAC domain-containing protein, partial [Thermoplasmata archaeon]|nr:NAC domain-containing protein [Thermoplasmata archaeon]
MFPGGRVNPRQMKAMMKRMGVSQEDIDGVEEIVIKTKSKEYIFHDAMV